jgi:hypothetical protein
LHPLLLLHRLLLHRLLLLLPLLLLAELVCLFQVRVVAKVAAH